MIQHAANADEEPAILLANVYYRNQVDVTQCLVSEAGRCAAVWDGRRLRAAATGHSAPTWFVDALPAQPLDGEAY